MTTSWHLYDLKYAQSHNYLNNKIIKWLVTYEKYNPQASLYFLCINMETEPLFSLNDPAISIL